MDDSGALRLTIGQVAQRIGVPVRTVRYWSDAGLVEPLARSTAGYRTYDAAALARLDLVRTLRALGLGLPAVRALIARRRTVAEVAAEHVDALDAEIRLLRLRRALWQHLATTATTTTIDPEELPVVNDLARLSARERQQLLDGFVERAFAGVPPSSPGTGIAAGMRTLPPELPDEPTAEQVSAWLELTGLVQDPAFADRVREMALAGAAELEPGTVEVDPSRLQALGRQALADGAAPGSERAEALVAELLEEAATDPQQRRGLAQRMATFTDRRVERYWTLLGVLNGWPAREPVVPVAQWWIEALAAPAAAAEGTGSAR